VLAYTPPEIGVPTQIDLTFTPYMALADG